MNLVLLPNLLPTLTLIPLFLWLSPSGCSASNSPPLWKWLFLRWEDGQVMHSVITAGAPTFNFSACDLFVTMKEVPPATHSLCRDNPDLYFCPSSNPGKSYCDHPGHYFCYSWGCETLASGWTPPTADPHLALVRNSDWPPYTLTVRSPSDLGWLLGRMWGARMFISGPDFGMLLMIKKEAFPAPIKSSMGPNGVLAPVTPLIPPSVTIPQAAPLPPNPDLSTPSVSPTPGPSFGLAPLWPLVQASYLLLNQSFPNLTESCWLCLDARPPYFDAIALNASYSTSNEDNPPECDWKDRKTGLTFQAVSGSGRCIGTISKPLAQLCDSVSSSPDKFYIPPQGAMWLCSTSGLTSCVAQAALSSTAEMCLLVIVLPHILYYPGEELYRYWEARSLPPLRVKREPVTAFTLATIFGGADEGTGGASLSLHRGGLSALGAAADEDLARMETSIPRIKRSFTSLSEVVIQNRRSLDLLTLHQRGLCAMHGMECCFYSDHLGAVRESMAKLREGLAARQREREARERRFGHIFDQSPWLSILISTLLGLILVLLLLLIFSPYVINRVVALVKDHVSSAQLLALRQQYQSVPSHTDAPCDDAHTPV
uniref:Syncytin-Opo1 n=1 Tax=Monodelphis brevicaudata TaxID=203680 RepID=A0A0A7DUR5_MONBV|nr:syncytin-Opo1 [Monodelphis brevicaudata]